MSLEVEAGHRVVLGAAADGGHPRQEVLGCAHVDVHVVRAIRRHRGAEHVRGAGRQERHGRVGVVHDEHERRAGRERVGDAGGRGRALDLERGDERLPAGSRRSGLPTPSPRRARRRRASRARPGAPARARRATTPTPASAGIENPNVINRSAGNQPVSNPTGAPSTTSAVHAASTRRANPLVRISPSAASGSASHWTYRVHRWSARSRYACRTASLMPARRRKPSFDVSTASRAGPIVIASSPAPTTAPPATVATATRPASLCHPRSCRASDHTATAARTSAPIRKNCGCVRPPPPNAIAAATTPRRRADRQAHRRRDERRGEREVREVARGEVHREQPGEEPGEHPRGACSAAFAGHGARGTDEHGRAHADRGPERRLERGGDGRHGQVRRAGEDGQERGAAGPLTDDREPLRRAHPCPPQVDGDVGADTEPVPVPDERREQHAEDEERQTPRATRGRCRCATCRCGPSATPWR